MLGDDPTWSPDIKRVWTWTDCFRHGDEMWKEYPRGPWEQMSTYLSASHCAGTLEEEDVFCPKDLRRNAYSGSSEPSVLKVKIEDSAGQSDNRKGMLSRMDVSKALFDAFINRILAYNYRTHIGLITFDTRAKIVLPLTHVVENFRYKISNVVANGDTALFGALALANDQLMNYSSKYPEVKKRIVCLSDGKDNTSNKPAHEIVRKFVQDKVIVDSFCIGEEDNEKLRGISYPTGGYKFAPKTLEQAMAICEMEPVLNQLELPSIRYPPESTRSDTINAPKVASGKATSEVVTRDSFPKRKEHPHLYDRFIELATVARRNTNEPSPMSNFRTARLMNEIKNVITNPHPY